jgi:membrane protein implicated in regulation of membrane protease activity
MDGGPLNWTNWVAGVVSVYASLFGVGQLLFGATTMGIVLLVLAAVCFAWIGRNLRPSREPMGPIPGVRS